MPRRLQPRCRTPVHSTIPAGFLGLRMTASNMHPPLVLEETECQLTSPFMVYMQSVGTAMVQHETSIEEMRYSLR